mgnify:FL=1
MFIISSKNNSKFKKCYDAYKPESREKRSLSAVITLFPSSRRQNALNGMSNAKLEDPLGAMFCQNDLPFRIIMTRHFN